MGLQCRSLQALCAHTTLRPPSISSLPFGQSAWAKCGEHFGHCWAHERWTLFLWRIMWFAPLPQNGEISQQKCRKNRWDWDMHPPSQYNHPGVIFFARSLGGGLYLGGVIARKIFWDFFWAKNSTRSYPCAHLCETKGFAQFAHFAHFQVRRHRLNCSVSKNVFFFLTAYPWRSQRAQESLPLVL